MDTRFIAWPFPIVKPEAEWDEFDRDFLEFMRIAYEECFKPRHENCSPIEAKSDSGRSVFLVRRGSRNGWEPWLDDGGKSVRLGPVYEMPLREHACVCIRPPFRAAGYFALEWLRGRSLESLLGEFFLVGGSPAGIELRADLAGLPRSSLLGRDRHIDSG